MEYSIRIGHAFHAVLNTRHVAMTLATATRRLHIHSQCLKNFDIDMLMVDQKEQKLAGLIGCSHFQPLQMVVQKTSCMKPTVSIVAISAEL